MIIVQEPHYYFCFKRTTVQRSQKQERRGYTQQKKQIMKPCGYAKISTTIQKLNKIIGDILLPLDQKQSKMVLNPLVAYFLFRNIAYDMITPNINKMTGYINIMKNMFESAVNSIVPGEKKDEKAFRKFMLSELQNTFNPTFQDYLNNNKYPRWKETESRESLLQEFDNICKKSKQNCKKNYLQIVKKYMEQRDQQKYERDLVSNNTNNNNSRRKNYFFENLNDAQIQRFVDAEFEQVEKVQILRKHLQYKRLKEYSERNKGYFNLQYCQFDGEKNTQKIYALKFNAISKEEEAVLLTFQDYLQLRQDNCNYTEESQQIIIDLCKELLKYKDKILEQNHQANGFYHHLSPTNAIIDQLSLQPKLSFVPCVEDAFGLAVKPYSIELKLAFNSTPKTFDYFQSQHQLNQNINRKLKDPYYGHEFVFSQKDQESKIKNAKQQHKKLLPIYESICVDRFLLLSHLIMKNKPFGKNKDKRTNKQIKDYFSKQLSKKKKSIQTNRKGISTFLGQGLVEKENDSDSFRFTLLELTEILHRRPQDSEVEKHRFHRFFSLSEKRHVAIRQITRILNARQRQYSKMPKQKKYLLILFIFFVEIIFEYMFLYKNAKRNPKDFVELFDLLQLGEQSRQEPFIGLQKNSTIMMDKVNKTIDRIGQDRQDSENRMINKCLSAQRHVKNQHKRVKELYKIIKSGQNIKHSRIKQMIQQAQQQAIIGNEQTRDYIYQYLFPQLNVRYANSARGNEQPQAIKQVTKRLQLSIYSFMSSTEQNFMIYDSLVFPTLDIRKENLYKQYVDLVDMIANTNNLKQKQRLMAASRYTLNEVDDIISYSIQLPNAYKRLRVPMGKWFINSDISNSTNQMSIRFGLNEQQERINNQNDEEREDVEEQKKFQKRNNRKN